MGFQSGEQIRDRLAMREAHRLAVLGAIPDPFHLADSGRAAELEEVNELDH